jgi:hypothetical protein
MGTPLVTENFESGAYSSVRAHTGSKSTVTNHGIMYSGGSVGAYTYYYGRLYFWYDPVIISSGGLITLWDGSAAYTGAAFITTPTSAVHFNGVDVTAYPSQWIRGEWKYTPGADTTETRVFYGANVEGTTPSASAAPFPAGTGGGVTDLWIIDGIGGYVSFGPGMVWIDDYAVTGSSSSSDWIGPLGGGPPPTVRQGWGITRA